MATEVGHVETRSVLFTDLVDSTQLRVRLGEAGADEVRRTHDALLAQAVTASGGSVVKGLGDGIMATFDSAADAVAGAIAVQQAIEAHGRRVPDQAFAIRVGVSIGDVSSEDGDVFGVPVVEASRLCTTAVGGEILAADLVRALARGRGDYTFEPMGAINLKGLPEPVSACRVIWEPLVLPSDGRTGQPVPIPPALLGAAIAYVGRDSLRARLADQWTATRGGACRSVLLAGEPGVGKTRTAAELARTAIADGALVLYGRCDEDLGVPYQPFVEALEYYVRHAAQPILGRLPGELRRLVPELATYVRRLPEAVSSDPASEEYRLFEATACWLVDAARDSAAGLVLVLDDIHWATKPTLRLMQHVLRAASTEAAPLLTVATYRDTDIDRSHPLSATLGELRRLPGVDRIAVNNWTREEVLLFIATAAGQELDDATQHLAEAVYAETEGNPFFVGEVLRHLIETGAIRREGDRWVVAEPEHLTVPEGVRDVVGRRLDRLSPMANEVLSVAAVIGRDFDVDVLIDVADLPEATTLDALDSAMHARLMEETGVDRYRFAHALVRTTLYEELSATRRRRLHRRVADILEKLRPTDVRALAFHCIEGGQEGAEANGRALKYTLAAAEQSLAARAFADAESGFRTALELVADGTDGRSAQQVGALCGLGEAQRDQGDPAFRQTLLDASELAVDIGDAALLRRAVLANTRGFASIIGGIDRDRLTFIEQALEMVGPEPTPDRARLLGQLASELTFSNEPQRRLELADEAEAMARALHDPMLIGEVLVSTAYAFSSGDRWERMLQRSAEGTLLADASGDPTQRALARVFQAGALLAAGKLEQSETVTRELIDVADEAGPLVRWTALFNECRLMILAGRLEDADALNNKSLELSTTLGQSDGDGWWGATLVGLMWLRGYGGLVADAAGDFAEKYPLSRTWRGAHAWLLAEAGRVEEARRIVSEYELDPQTLLAEPLHLVAPFQLARAAWWMDDPALGAQAVAALGPYRRCWSHFYLLVMGPVTWALGVALATTGALDDAVVELEDALGQTEAHDLTVYSASIRTDLATVLQRRNEAGDWRSAAAQLATARAEATELGAAGLVERIDRLDGVVETRG